MLADPRCWPLNLRGCVIEARRGFGLADEADVRMVQFDDELARHYLLVGDHIIAPQHWRRRHIVGIEPFQPLRCWTLFHDLRH